MRIFRYSRFALFVLVATLCLSVASGQRLQFDKAIYTSDVNRIVTAIVEVNPLPSNGLFSVGFAISIQGTNGIVGAMLVKPSTEFDFSGPLGVGADAAQIDNTAGLKGTIDFFDLSKMGSISTRVGTVDIGGLPEGNYTLALSPFFTLGTKEQLFVTGSGDVLDSAMTFGTATLSISNAVFSASAVSGSDITLDRQKGVLVQTVRLTNSGTFSPSAFRIVVSGLPVGAKVLNAHGITAGGLPYIQYENVLAPGASTNVVVEYFGSGAKTTMVPQFEVLAGEVAAALIEGELVAVQPRLLLKDGSLLLEFDSAEKRLYWIQYSDDLVSWKTAQPAVIGTGNRVQWFDTGPPRTASKPLVGGSSRFYRIRLVVQ